MPSFVKIITFSSGIYMATSSSKGHAFQSKSEQVFEKRSLYLEWQVLVLTDYGNLASSFPKMNKLCLSKSAKRFLFDCLYQVILRMFFFVVNVCSHSAGQATLLFLPLVQLTLTHSCEGDYSNYVLTCLMKSGPKSRSQNNTQVITKNLFISHNLNR